MDKIIKNDQEDQSTTPNSISTVTRLAHQLTGSISSVFGSQSHRRRISANVVPSLESLEERTMMSASPLLAHRSDDTPISNSAPVYLLDGDGFIDVSVDQPVTISASALSTQKDVAVRAVMVANKELAHRNQLQHAIIGQASLDGWGVIYNLYGNGEDARNIFQYPALPDDAVIDIELTYDGERATLTLSHEGQVFAEETLDTPDGPTHIAPAITDGNWSGSTTTFTEVKVLQGKNTEEEKEEIEEAVPSGALSEEFTILSGNADIQDDGITFTNRSHIVSAPQTERLPGETQETRIHLTLRPSDDTHIYLYNDTESYNHETGHGVILIPGTDSRNIGVIFMEDGEAISDSRASLPLSFGEYLITMTDNDDSHTTVITLPDGTKQTYLQPQTLRQNGGRTFINAGGATIHSFEVVQLNEHTVTDSVFADPELLDSLLTNTPVEAIDTVPIVIAQMQDPVGLSRKTPHFFTDHTDVNADDPVRVLAEATFEHQYSYPSILIAENATTDHRNGLRNAIYVQIDRHGNGNIVQFLGSDDNRQSPFTYEELPVGATVDVGVTYDGSKVDVVLTYDGRQIAEHSFTPPIAYGSPLFGASNIKWDSDEVSATLQSFVVTQGEEEVEREEVVEVVEEEEEIEAIEEFPDTPESRLLAFEARKADIQQQINANTLEMTDIETLLARQEVLLTEAQQLTSAAEDILERFHLQENIELLRVTPSIRINVERFKPNFDLHYIDMPAGHSVKFYNQTIAIPEGSGKLKIGGIPRTNRNVAYSLDLLDEDGKKVTTLTDIKVVYGKTNRVSAMNSTKKLPQISFIPGLAEEEKVSDSLKAEADQMKIDATAMTQMITPEIAQLTQDRDAQRGEINALERQKIPYSRMHIEPGYSGDQPTFRIQYASNQPQTYIELIMQGGGDYKRTFEHAGGQEDGFVEVNMQQLLQHNHTNGGAVEIKMYTDDSKSELLDSFRGNYSSKTNTTHGETNGDWGDLETGRIIENPYTPQMAIAQLSGPNIIVSVQTPHDDTYITMEGGGLFNTAHLSHEGGAELASARLTFNADNPEWNYRIRVMEGRNNTQISEMTVHWDPTTKEISTGAASPIVATQDTEAAFVLQAMRRQLAVQSTVDNIDIHIASLRNVQLTHLYDASNFVIDADDAALYINNSPLKGHPDASGIFHQTLGGYEDSAKNALEAAAKIAVAAWNGQSQIDAREVFDRAYGVASNNRYLHEFMIDFHGVWPSADQFMKEGIRLAELQADGFAENGAKELRMYKREAFLANGGGAVGSSQFLVGEGFGEDEVASVNPDGTLVGSEQQVEEHIQSTIADRVAARLNERLASMSLEERAEARGLLRLQKDGKLEEYLKKILANRESNITTIQSEEGGIDVENVTFSFLVSRPLYAPPANLVASHMFIVTNAKYLGDPNAEVISFGKNSEGNVGRLYDATNQSDIGAWRLLEKGFNPDGNAQVEFRLIPATTEMVKVLADSVIENDPYNILGPNSNSAAQAIANAASNATLIPPGLDNRYAPGYEDANDIEFSN